MTAISAATNASPNSAPSSEMTGSSAAKMSDNAGPNASSNGPIATATSPKISANVGNRTAIRSPNAPAPIANSSPIRTNTGCSASSVSVNAGPNSLNKSATTPTPSATTGMTATRTSPNAAVIDPITSDNGANNGNNCGSSTEMRPLNGVRMFMSNGPAWLTNPVKSCTRVRKPELAPVPAPIATVSIEPFNASKSPLRLSSFLVATSDAKPASSTAEIHLPTPAAPSS